MLVMMCSVCADPLSSYPTAKMLSQLKVDQWLKLGHHLNLTDEELESLKKSPHPTAATLITAKSKNIDVTWKDIAESLLHIGEYKLAETVCSQQGLSLASSSFPLSVQSFTAFKNISRICSGGTELEEYNRCALACRKILYRAHLMRHAH